MPKSGWRITRAVGTPTNTPNLNKSRSLISPVFSSDKYRATTNIITNLTNSEICRLKPRIRIHRREPNTSFPKANVANRAAIDKP